MESSDVDNILSALTWYGKQMDLWADHKITFDTIVCRAFYGFCWIINTVIVEPVLDWKAESNMKRKIKKGG